MPAIPDLLKQGFRNLPQVITDEALTVGRRVGPEYEDAVVVAEMGQDHRDNESGNVFQGFHLLYPGSLHELRDGYCPAAQSL